MEAYTIKSLLHEKTSVEPHTIIKRFKQMKGFYLSVIQRKNAVLPFTSVNLCGFVFCIIDITIR